MTTWRGMRKELVGAWRSVQYDIARVRSRGTAGETTELIFPERSSPPRRLAATGAFALASVAGAVATYFAVVSGLGSLLETEANAQEAPAPAVAGVNQAGTGQRPAIAAPDETVRIARGGGPLTVAGRQAAAGSAGSSGTRGGEPPAPVRHPGAPVPEESDAPPGDQPPAPTQSPTAAPTDGPDGSPSPSPSPSPSASPSPGATDDEPGERRRRWPQHRHDQDEQP